MTLGIIGAIILGISIVIGSVAHIILKKKDSAIEQIEIGRASCRERV